MFTDFIFEGEDEVCAKGALVGSVIVIADRPEVLPEVLAKRCPDDGTDPRHTGLKRTAGVEVDLLAGRFEGLSIDWKANTQQ